MKHWFAVLALLGLLAVTSCAATFRVTCHAPTQDDDGDCINHVLTPTVGGLVRVNLTWRGPVTGSDQLIVQPGTLCVFTRTVPAGNYHFEALTADSLGNTLLCPAMVDVLVRGKYAAISDLK